MTTDPARSVLGAEAETPESQAAAATRDSFVTYDELWLPYSRSYVALGLEGRAVASFGKSYVWVGGRRIDLPGYVAASRSGHRSQPARGEVCPGCHQESALNGACPNDCD